MPRPCRHGGAPGGSSSSRPRGGDHRARDAVPRVALARDADDRLARLRRAGRGAASSHDARPSASWVTASGPTSNVSHGRTSAGDRRGQRARDLRHARSGRRRPAARRTRRPRRRPSRTPPGTCSASRARRPPAARRRARRARAGRPSARGRRCRAAAARYAAASRPERVEERGQLGQLAPVLAPQRARPHRGRRARARRRALERRRGTRRSRRRAAARPARARARAARRRAAARRPWRRSACRRRRRSGRAAGRARPSAAAASADERVKEDPAGPSSRRRRQEPSHAALRGLRAAASGSRGAKRATSTPGGPSRVRSASPGSGSAAHRLSAVWREPTSTPRAPREPLAGGGQEARMRLDRVLQRAAVDLDRVGHAGARERPGEDQRAHHQVVGQRDVRARPCDDLAHGRDVALHVAPRPPPRRDPGTGAPRSPS